MARGGGSGPGACCVTGGAGLVGRRLAEMLAERGARRVVAFDIAPKPADWDDSIEYFQVGALPRPGVSLPGVVAPPPPPPRAFPSSAHS